MDGDDADDVDGNGDDGGDGDRGGVRRGAREVGGDVPAPLRPLVELAREQLGADVVLAFRWLDDLTALSSVSLPAGAVGPSLILPLPRPAIAAAGGLLFEVADPHGLAPATLHAALPTLPAPPRAAAVIAATPTTATPGAACAAGGLLVVWLGGAADERPPLDGNAAAPEPQRLERCGALLQAALGAVFASTVDAMSAGQLSDRLVAILTALPQAVVFVDDAGENSVVNRAAAVLLGVEPGPLPTDALAGRMSMLQRSLENGAEVRERMGELAGQPDAHVEDWTWRLAGPPRRSLGVASVPVRALGLRGRLWTFDDITREVDAERAARASEARFRALGTSSPVGIFQTDVSGGMVYANPRLHQLWGMSDGEMLGRGWMTRVHPDDLQAIAVARRAAIAAAREYALDYRLLMPDGTTRLMHARVAWLRNDDGEVMGGVGTVKDVTERRATERALAESEERLRLALEAAQMSAWDLDLRPATGRTTTSPAASRVLGAGELGLSFVGDNPSRYESLADFLRAVHPEDRDRVELAAALALSQGRDFEGEFRVVSQGGGVRWRYVKGRMMLGEDGTPERMVGVGIDSTDRKLLEQELTRRAFHDPLTDLPNRALFRERVEEVAARAAGQDEAGQDAAGQDGRRRNAAFRHAARAGGGRGEGAVLFIDLDGFKAVNDSFGHDAGDRLLVLTASRLLSVTRASDTTARLGGDEFAILLDGVAGDEAQIAAGRVIAALSAPFDVDGRQVTVGASVGIAVVREGDDVAVVLRDADLAMYRAKGAGKGRFAI